MREFIKNIFVTPVNLWTLPQELFFFTVVIGGILIITGLCVLGTKIFYAIKYRKCSLNHSIKIDCGMKCENCKWKKKRRN